MRTTTRAMPTQAPNDVARVVHAEFQKALLELSQIANMALSSAGLAIGTPNTGVVIANTVTFLSRGEFRTKTTAQVAFTATTHDIPANASAVQEAVYVISLQSNGTVTVTMGEIASGAGNAVVPAGPEGETVIGHVRVAVDAGATPFNATTDALNAGHLTVTYTNTAFVLPGESARGGAQKITATR